MPPSSDVPSDPRSASRWPWVALVLLYGPFWVFVLGAKVWLFAKHLPDVGLVGFVDGMWPQLVALIGLTLFGYVGLVLSRRWLLVNVLTHAFLLVMLAFMELPLLFGLDQSGSAVRWGLAAWWIEWNGTAPDGSWFMWQRVIAMAVVLTLSTILGLLGPERTRVLKALGAAAIAFLLAGVGPLGGAVPRYLARDAVVYVLQSTIGVEAQWARMKARPVSSGMVVERGPAKPLNVVVVFLESVGWNATSLNPGGHATTPYLAQLAETGLVAEQAYVVVPSTYKAHVAALCGVEPYFTGDREIFDRPFDFGCLPAVLRDRGYDTVYFTSSGRDMLGWAAMVKHLGYDTFLGYEDMPTEGFAYANMWAYEDDIMLGPSRDWHQANDGPFLATYMVCAPHYEYLAPTRYGRQQYVKDDEHNRYLNAVHYTDRFLENLIGQYEQLGLADDTVFVVMGDHGEAFGEHVPRQHNAVPYEEAVRVPLVVHQPGRWPSGRVATGLRSQLDVTPTLAELMGLAIQAGTLDGTTLTGPPGRDRVFTSCLYTHTCATVLDPPHKLIHHFGDRPDELFDLRADPLERTPLDDDVRAASLREAVLHWYAHGL